MAKITTTKADAPAAVETIDTTTTMETPVVDESASIAQTAQADAPAPKTKRPRKPKDEDAAAFPWNDDLDYALLETAVNIDSGHSRGGLTLDALKDAFSPAAAGTVAPEDLALLTPAEIKKRYITIGRNLAKAGHEVPELVVGRKRRIDVERLAALLASKTTPAAQPIAS